MLPCLPSSIMMRSLVVICLGTIVLLSACSLEKAPYNEPIDSMKAPQKKISIMLPQYMLEPSGPDNPGIQFIQQHTGYELELKWVLGDAYDDKLHASIASGGLPQVITVLDHKDASMINGIRSGMFWEIGPYIQDYPNLSKIRQEELHNIAVDGKVYGLPRSRPVSRQGMIFRKDWLDYLKLDVPTTVDELYTTLKAFSELDPDQNGKADTFGLATSADNFNTLSVIFGAPNEWSVQDGRIIPAFKTPEYLQAMQFLRKLYAEKLINQDLLIVNDRFLDYMNQNQAGMLLAEMDAVTTAHFSDLKKLAPNSEIDIYSPIAGPNGTFTIGTHGFAGVLMFPHSSVKTEEELKNLLTFYDRLGDEAIQDMTKYGVEGSTYTMEGAIPNVDSERYNQDINQLNQLMVQFGFFDAKRGDSPMEAKWKRLLLQNEAYAVYDPTVPLISKTFTEKGAPLKTQIDDARNRFVIGELDEAGWYEAIEQWTNDGGKQIEDEFTEAYSLHHFN